MKYGKYILGSAAVFAVGFLISFFFFPSSADEHRQLSECEADYGFISPETDCGAFEEIRNQITQTKQKIEKIADVALATKRATKVSVFYRDINSKRWMGVNHLEQFYPASLFKLPVAIVYYKIAEVEPKILDQPFTVSEEDNQRNALQQFTVKDMLETNKTYDAKTLIYHMLAYSDNAPLSLLVNAVEERFREKIFRDLDIQIPIAESGKEGWNITARSYGNIFRVLYNASYLDIGKSNEILHILSESRFTDGLVAGVPKGTKIAHKFGEAAAVQSADNAILFRSLHDCGIVYKPQKPYILCVMTEGADITSLSQIIANISQVVYDAQ